MLIPSVIFHCGSLIIPNNLYSLIFLYYKNICDCILASHARGGTPVDSSGYRGNSSRAQSPSDSKQQRGSGYYGNKESAYERSGQRDERVSREERLTRDGRERERDSRGDHRQERQDPRMDGRDGMENYFIML